MADKQQKTLEQITQDVLNSHFGITDDDLVALFADTTAEQTTGPATGQANSQDVQAAAPTETTETAMPQEPSASTQVPPTVAPDHGRAGSLPPDLDATIKTQQQQIEKLQLMLQELAQRAAAQTRSAEAESKVANPLDEIDDQQIIEKPKESIVKLVNTIMKVVLPAAFAEYDAALNARAMMEEFRRTHPDFDELRPIMRQIVLEDPATNDNPAALPRVYEEAKRRKAAVLDALKRELAGQPTASGREGQPSEEELLAKLEQRIADKIRKRRAGAGAASPVSQPVQPPARMAPTTKEMPKSEADALIEAMLAAGSPSERFLRDVDTTKK